MSIYCSCDHQRDRSSNLIGCLNERIEKIRRLGFFFFFPDLGIGNVPFSHYLKDLFQKMGNCSTSSSDSGRQSLDPACNGQRMWTTFLFSSLFTLFGGWSIILIYDFLKALFIKQRLLKLLLSLTRFSFINEVNLMKIAFR
jgi:hypothetical protein